MLTFVLFEQCLTDSFSTGSTSVSNQLVPALAILLTLSEKKKGNAVAFFACVAQVNGNRWLTRKNAPRSLDPVYQSVNPCIGTRQKTKIRASKLRGVPESDLQKQLGDLKTELSSLRLYRVTRGTSYHGKLKKIRVLRKSIARVYTVMHQAQKERQREAYRSKRYVPKDLRPKKTRAIRRRLSRKERSIHSAKSMHKARAYPPRIYAVKR
ncbi:hypothetical protein T265_11726 [Opisthorchis viverrini]|uniref:Large ribosomal subunit protein uL29 n=1 Tax=Opisthorchis viverrini TaxID=6198 RepID=A0A074YXY3_OPIVI|nr:hypothetical protein T265_11726 [Opisthorchis viverrini]KER19528.1 hypothetical protein T265_11726 [Opisthorchis viverrini]